jgi:hypothetical protein
MPGVFTYFNHGTCAHRDNDGEIVAEFGRLAYGLEYSDFLILDGPGSNPVTAPIPGQYNPFTRDRAPKQTFGNTEMGHTHINWQMTGVMSGSGWDDNVMHAIAVISELDPLPAMVNMIGWSRGAVTCTKLAYKLREIYPQIAVNIFAVDPVAGIGNKGDVDCSTIRSNVRNYLAVLSMHETRGFFKPQDIKRVTFTSSGTNAIYLPFPGNHSGQVNLDKCCMKGIGESPQIVWYLAMKFLKNFGTAFTTDPSPNYSHQEICNLYAKMQLKMSSYKRSSPGFFSGALGGRKTRDFLNNRHDQYVKHAGFFINEHHRRVFKRAYPLIYDWVFEDRGSNSMGVTQEFKGTRNLLGLRSSLEGLGFKEKPGTTTMLPIRGSRKQEVGIVSKQHTSSLGLMGVY